MQRPERTVSVPSSVKWKLSSVAEGAPTPEQGSDAIMLIGSVLVFAAATGAADAQVAIGPDQWLRFAIPRFEVGDEASFFQVVIEQQVIIRVPARRSSVTSFQTAEGRGATRSNRIVWKEHKGPKCVSMREIAAMQTTQRDSIDLITRQNQRLRAQFDRGCQALDFYAGFYMEGNRDGRLCAKRDQLHARTGTKCEVARFRLMVPERRED